jgi:hypothetical protein
MSGLFVSSHKSATITCALQTTIGGTFGYAANRFRVEGRKKSARQGYCSTRRGKHNPSHCRQERNFDERCKITKKAPPSDCGRAQAIINADEKAMVGEKEKGFLSQ